MNIIKIGVMGCAKIAERSIIPAIKNLSSTYELIGVASRSIDKATQYAAKFNCKAFGSYDDLLKQDKIDAVYIPLPTGLHNEWINKAIKYGKHVYAEKSIAAKFSEAEFMVENSKKSKLAIMEGYMFQYHEQHKHLLELINNGLIGEIRHFSSSFGFPPLNPKNFRYNNKIGGGALYDAAGYPLRAAFKILGDNLDVQGATIHWDEQTGTSIYGSAYLVKRDGVGASISFGFDNFYQCNYQIWGSKGKIIVEKAFTPKADEIPTFTFYAQNEHKVINSVADNHFEKALLEFYKIIKNPEQRSQHYKEILQQSRAQEKIKIISKNSTSE